MHESVRGLSAREAQISPGRPANRAKPGRSIALKRAREGSSPEDGVRVLVDRLWPRGMTKDQVAVDLWLKEAAPSAELRRWYGHDPRRWAAFASKYRAELSRRADLLRMLDELYRREPITFVYDASDTVHNNAAVLRDFMTERLAADAVRHKTGPTS